MKSTDSLKVVTVNVYLIQETGSHMLLTKHVLWKRVVTHPSIAPSQSHSVHYSEPYVHHCLAASIDDDQKSATKKTGVETSILHLCFWRWRKSAPDIACVRLSAGSLISDLGYLQKSLPSLSVCAVHG